MSRVEDIKSSLLGVTFTEGEAQEIITMIQARTRVKYPKEYLLQVGREHMPDWAYIKWAKDHLDQMDD